MTMFNIFLHNIHKNTTMPIISTVIKAMKNKKKNYRNFNKLPTKYKDHNII